MCLETVVNLCVEQNPTGVVRGGGGPFEPKSVSRAFLEAINRPHFVFHVQMLAIRNGRTLTMTELSKYLKRSVSEELPHLGDDAWKLAMKFHLNMARTSIGVDEVDSIDVFVEGDLFVELLWIMSCSTYLRRLNLRLSVGLQAMNGNGVLYSFGIKDMDLLPRVIHCKDGDPTFDDGKYECLHFKPEVGTGQKRIDFDKITSWKLGGAVQLELDAFVTGPVCQFTTSGMASYSRMVKGDFLDNGKETDMKIILKEGTSISCHKNILTAASPVFGRELTGDFVEARTGEIKMLQRTEEVVLAFLSFLYQRKGSAKALEDPSMTLTLLEMAHQYDVKGMEAKMEKFLANISIDRFSVDDALNLIGMAGGMIMNDRELKKKGLDVLTLHSDEEIVKSPVFTEVFPTALGREIFLRSRKRF